MSQDAKRSPLKRLHRGISSRAFHQARHALLRSIELLPAPLKFAWRNWVFSRFSSLFKGTPTFESWKEAYRYFVTERSTQIDLINLKTIPAPRQIAAKKIAIQAHLFYPDLANELATLLAQFPAPFDLLISSPDQANEHFLRTQFACLPQLQELHIAITPNQGRDLGPLLFGFGADLLQYDYFAHVHTKKSSGTNQIGDAWRRYLYEGLLDNTQGRVTKILDLLDRYGMVYPQRFAPIDVHNCQWQANWKVASAFCTSANVPIPSPGFIEFPVGSMFWAQTAALKPLLEQAFTPESFEIEQGQTDNTLAHALERSLSHIALAQGYRVAIIEPNYWLSYYP